MDKLRQSSKSSLLRSLSDSSAKSPNTGHFRPNFSALRTPRQGRTGTGAFEKKNQ